jgi:UDP-glucose-4-epimerase GalE
MVKMLMKEGHQVTVFDNLSRGFRDAVMTDDFVQGDLLNKEDLNNLFQDRAFDVVMHFSALCYVGESVQYPLMYYRNNVEGTLNLLDAMRIAGVNKFVFSSSCALYGIPQAIPITEAQQKNPVNPYGWTKLFVENILRDCAEAYGLQSVSLRYFNAAGCDPAGQLGERHDPETHLIPLVLKEALRVQAGGNPDDTNLLVFGDDYDTPDGTCVRDYIHVEDLCAAHMLAMKRLLNGNVDGAEAYNLGNGKGFSVKEVIEACGRVTGIDIRYKVVERRPGDPPVLVGSAEKAKKVLGWEPKYTHLKDIIETAWRWVDKIETNI